jgi:hypothetical protein
VPGNILAAGIETNLSLRTINRAREAQAAGRIQEDENAISGAERGLAGRYAGPFVDRQNLARLYPGNWPIDAEAQLDGGNPAVENRGLLAS